MLTSWQNTLHNAQCHVILGPLLLLCTTSLECTFEECRAVSLLSVLSLMLSEKEGDIILLYSEQRNDFSCQGELSIQLSFISNPIMHILTCCTICNILQILNAIKWYFTQCNIFLTEQWHFDIIFAVTLVWEVVLVDVRQFSNCKLCVIHYCQNSSEMSLLWCPRALSALQDLSHQTSLFDQGFGQTFTSSSPLAPVTLTLTLLLTWLFISTRRAVNLAVLFLKYLFLYQ